MKKFLAGLALSAALVAGTAATVSTPANAAIYVGIGGGHHHGWHGGGRGYYWHNRYWHNRYHCHRGWCYR